MTNLEGDFLGQTNPSTRLVRASMDLAYGIYDMVKGKRLTEADIPDDYEWLRMHHTETPLQI